MPARSKAQFRMMQAMASGSMKPVGGMTRAKAAEFVKGQSPKGLPAKVKKSKS